jgi:hypothetical protein
LILGDSNLSRISAIPNLDIQIESYPGAQFRHIGSLGQNYEHPNEPEDIILSIGINNRASKTNTTSLPEFRTMITKVCKAFPNSKIHVPAINYSALLPQHEQDNLAILNECISNHNKVSVIPPLVQNKFVTEVTDKSHIHWSAGTASIMIRHWLKHLN